VSNLGWGELTFLTIFAVYISAMLMMHRERTYRSRIILRSNNEPFTLLITLVSTVPSYIHVFLLQHPFL
jgi:hypothetical protein